MRYTVDLMSRSWGGESGGGNRSFHSSLEGAIKLKIAPFCSS